jgi:hypothetical protein
MPWNNKDWQDRLTEIYNAINYLGQEQGMEYADTVAIDLKNAIEGLPTQHQQEQYSNSLHIDSHRNLDKEARKWIRVLAAIEQVLVRPLVQRTFATIVGTYRGQTAADVKRAVKQLIKSLDPFPASPDLARVRPLQVGCSVSGGGHPGPGSICCFVRDNTSGRIGLLSNQHVIRAEGLDKPLPTIYQPAKNNGGSNADNVGTFVRGFLNADLDAAYCELDNGVNWANSTRDTPKLASVAIAGVSSNF